MYLVARGADPDQTGRAEVHCFWTDRYVVTVHRGDCPAIAQVHERLGAPPLQRGAPRRRSSSCTSIVERAGRQLLPVLSEFDDRIDALEDDILKAPTEAQLGELFDMKRTLMDMRKVIAPQRDMMASINSGVTDVPGMTDEATRYFRDLYDHLIRLADLVDNYRDLLERRHGHAPLHRVEPPERRDEAADHHRHDLPAAQLPDRVLRAELRLPGPGAGWRRPGASSCSGSASRSSRSSSSWSLFRRRGWLGGPTV